MVSAPPKPPRVHTLHCKGCGKVIMEAFGLKPTNETSKMGVSKKCKCGHWNMWPLVVLD